MQILKFRGRAGGYSVLISNSLISNSSLYSIFLLLLLIILVYKTNLRTVSTHPRVGRVHNTGYRALRP